MFTRTDEWFHSESIPCAAAVYRPDGALQTPAVVMGHGFGTPRAVALYTYADAFARAGYTVVVFDYRYFGESAGTPRQLLDIRKQLHDWRNALAFTRALEWVNPHRIIAWGTSFAGGHVLSLAGAGEDFAAVIAQVPHVSGPAAVRATGLRACLRLAPLAAEDLVRAVCKAQPRYVNSVGHPGEVAVMTAPGSMAGLDAMLEASGLVHGIYPETVAARVLAHIGFYSPGRRAHRISCPVLFHIMSDDAVTPTQVALKTADKVPDATVHVHEGGHFAPYVEPLFSTIIREQVEFLRRVVPVK